MRGKKGEKHYDPEDPPRRRANKQRGHGTYDNDRPPVVGTVGRRSGQVRLRVVKHTVAKHWNTLSPNSPYLPPESILTSGGATTPLFVSMLRSTMAFMNGHVTMTVMVFVKFIPTLLKACGLDCVSSLAHFEVCTRSICLVTLQFMNMLSISRRFRLSLFPLWCNPIS